jgi:hypothetical protein
MTGTGAYINADFARTGCVTELIAEVNEVSENVDRRNGRGEWI